jgi:hypothetical protein
MTDGLVCNLYYENKGFFEEEFVRSVFNILSNFGFEALNPYDGKVQVMDFSDNDNPTKHYSFEGCIKRCSRESTTLQVWLSREDDLLISFEPKGEEHKPSWERYKDQAIFSVFSIMPNPSYTNKKVNGLEFVPILKKIIIELFKKTSPVMAWCLTEYMFEELVDDMDFQLAAKQLRAPSTLGWIIYFSPEYVKALSASFINKIDGKKETFGNGGIAVVLADYPWEITAKDIQKIYKKWLNDKNGNR